MKRLNDHLACREYEKKVSKATASENGLTFELVNDSDFENKSDLEIKLFILKHLENTGAISGDVYSLELEELGIEENDEY